MIFLNDKKIALKLKNDEISSKESFVYFLITIVLSELFILFVAHENFKFNSISVIVDLFNYLVMIVGAYIAYKTNSKGDNKKYIERYMILSLPILLRLFIFSFFSTIIVLLMVDFHVSRVSLRYLISNHLDLFEDIFMSIGVIYYYWRLNTLMKIASHP